MSPRPSGPAGDLTDGCAVRVSLCRYVDLDASHGPQDAAVLSAPEAARCARLRFAADRARYTTAHATLRHLLAQQGAPAAADRLELREGPLGKPWLAQQPGLRFSLSHSQGLALIAIGRHGPLGADIERLRPMPDALGLARCCLTPRENAALGRLPRAHRDRALLTCWTRKEACLKATGLGLQVPLRMLEVGLAPALRRVRFMVGGKTFCVRVGPAPARPDSVASLAEWLWPAALFDAPGALVPLLARQARNAADPHLIAEASIHTDTELPCARSH